MPSFSVEFERLWAQRAQALGRDLTRDESRALENGLFQSWMDAGRLDELIRTIHANSGRDGGLEEIVALGRHLRETQDVPRIHALFRGLISRRVKAFHEWWPRASTGHVGGIREAAKAAAEAMDAYVEYFLSLERLGLETEQAALREEMLRFQAREPVNKVLPRTAPPSVASAKR